MSNKPQAPPMKMRLRSSHLPFPSEMTLSYSMVCPGLSHPMETHIHNVQPHATRKPSFPMMFRHNGLPFCTNRLQSTTCTFIHNTYLNQRLLIPVPPKPSWRRCLSISHRQPPATIAALKRNQRPNLVRMPNNTLTSTKRGTHHRSSSSTATVSSDGLLPRLRPRSLRSRSP